MSQATCGDRCWSAKGDTCSCVCGGANHGTLRVNPSGSLWDSEEPRIPRRTRRIGSTWYKLAENGFRDGLVAVLKREGLR